MTTGLLFLHGVGQHDSDDDWRPSLDTALADLGYAGLDEISHVVAPKYSDLLCQDDLPKCPMPPRTAQDKGDRWQARRDYEVDQASLRRLLGVDGEVDPTRGFLSDIPENIAELMAKALMDHHPELQQAGRYLREERVRAAILTRVLDALPATDRLVIVGHSLGSLVAIDLLDHLPRDVSVPRVITLGSPAGMKVMHEESERLLRDFPYGHIRSWVNFLSPFDPVTSGRGLTWLFPAAHDMRVDLPLMEHAAEAYLRQPRVALGIGQALFGSLSQAVQRIQTDVQAGLTLAESQAMFALAFAHMTHHEMTRSQPDDASRYGAALAVVQSAAHEALVDQAVEQGRPVAQVVEDLESGNPPQCPRAWTFEQAVRVLVVAATTNLVAPWEIEAVKAARAALPAACVGLGFGAQQGSKVGEAIGEARKAVGLDRDVAWERLALGAAGVALVVAAPIGLALAAPAGLAGAAALTSALAAFGPGGMVGGMALAGTLVGTGSVAAASAALADAPQPVLELEVVRRLAHARSRQLLGLLQDPSDWALITDMHSRVSEELDRLGAFSDKSAPSVHALRAKVSLLDRATKWMVEKGLGRAIPEIED